MWGNTPEERAEGEEIQNLSNKVNPVASFASGMLGKIPSLISGAAQAATKAAQGIVNAGNSEWITDNQKEAATEALANAENEIVNARENANIQSENMRRQNPVANVAGNLAGTALQYNAVNSALEGTKTADALTSVLGERGANLALGEAADIALDTLPTEVENYQNGMRGADLAKDTAANLALNAAINTGTEFIPGLVKNLFTNRNTAQAAGNVIEDAAKSAPVENVAKTMPEIPSIRNVDPVTLARNNADVEEAAYRQQMEAAEAMENLSKQIPDAEREPIREAIKETPTEAPNLGKYEGKALEDINSLEMAKDARNEVNNRIKGMDNILSRIDNATTREEVENILSEGRKLTEDTDNILKKSATTRMLGEYDLDEETKALAEALNGRKIYVSPEMKAELSTNKLKDISDQLYFKSNEGRYKPNLYGNAGKGAPLDTQFAEIDEATGHALSNYMRNNGLDPEVPENQLKGLVEYANSLKASKDSRKVANYTGGLLSEYGEELEKRAADKLTSFGNIEKEVNTKVNPFDRMIDARNSGTLDNAYKQSLDELEAREKEIISAAQKYNNPEVAKMVKEETRIARKSWNNLYDVNNPIDVNTVKAHQTALDNLENYMKNNPDTGIKQLNKVETPKQEIPDIKSNELNLNLQFFSDKAKKLEQEINGMEEGEEKNRLKKALSDFWSRFTGAKSKEEAEEAWNELSKTRTNTMAKGGDYTDYELENVFPEADARYLREAETIPYDAAKAQIEKNPKAMLKRYTQKFKSDKDARHALGNAQDINGMHIMMQDITKKARATEDMAKRNELYAQARQISRNLYKANRELGRGVQANAKFSRTPERVIQNAQGFADNLVEKALEKNPNLEKGIKEVSDQINNFLKDMDTSAMNREQVEDMVRRAIISNKRVSKRIGKGDIQKITDAIMNEKQYVDVQKQLEFLSTGFGDIDANTIDKVQGIFEEAQKLNLNSKKRMNMENEAYKLLASKIAPNGGSFRDKFDAWRYLSMLGNPTTHIKNITGNVLFGKGMVSAKNSIGAMIEEAADRVSKAAGKGGIERTKALLSPKDAGLVKAAGEDGLENAFRELSGSKYFDAAREIDNSISAFSNKSVIGRFLNKASEINSGALEAADEKAMMDKYKTSLAGFLKANGADESIFKATDPKSVQLLESGRAYAINQAKEAAFHQDNATADFLSQFTKDLRNSDSGVARALGLGADVVVPFKKTPANILKSAFEYSPMETLTCIKDVSKLNKGIITPAEFIDDISKAATGWGAFGLGALLAHEGILKVGSDKSGEEESFDKQTGRQSVAIKVGDRYVAVQELIPSAAPLIFGGTIYETIANKKGGENALDTVVAGMGAIANGVIDMSMLSGIVDTINSVRGAESNKDVITNLAINVGGNLASQLLPTLGRKTNVTLDDTKRSTYSDKAGATKKIDQEVKYLQTKIPGLQQAGEAMKGSNVPALKKAGERLALEPNIDVKGQEQTSPGFAGFNNLAGRAAGNFISPVNITKDTSTKYDDERRRLEKATGESKVLPYISTKEAKVGDKQLNPSEWTEYRKSRGQLREKLAEGIIDSAGYKNLSDADKAALLVEADKFSKEYSQSKYGKELSSSTKKLAEVYEKEGVKGFVDSVQLQNALSDAPDSKQETKLATVRDMSPEDQKRLLPKAITTKEEQRRWKSANGDVDKYWQSYDAYRKEELEKENRKKTEQYKKEAAQKKQLEAAHINAEQGAKIQEELTSYGVKDNTESVVAYTHAKQTIPSLSAREYAGYVDKMSRGDGQISQSDVIKYANQNHLSSSEMDKYWKAFTNTKKIPKLSKKGNWYYR